MADNLDINSIISMLYFAAITWGVGLTPPLLIRFVLIRHFLSIEWALGVTVALFLSNILIFNELGATWKTYWVLFLVAFASYVIMRIGANKPIKETNITDETISADFTTATILNERQQKNKRPRSTKKEWLLFFVVIAVLVAILATVQANTGARLNPLWSLWSRMLLHAAGGIGYASSGLIIGMLIMVFPTLIFRIKSRSWSYLFVRAAFIGAIFSLLATSNDIVQLWKNGKTPLKTSSVVKEMESRGIKLSDSLKDVLNYNYPDKPAHNSKDAAPVEDVSWVRLQQLAESGDAEAQTNLGSMYFKGEGVPKDAAKAMEWFQKAAAQEYAVGQSFLGLIYQTGEGVPKDAAKAVGWYQKAAAQGYAGAQINLGSMYFKGEGVPKDVAKAVEWYQKAAAQGDAEAQTYLGWMYSNGEGVSKDVTKAAEWYQKAAAQGYAGAQLNLGIMYNNGEGMQKDLVIAYAWINLAAAQDYENASNARDMIELNSAQRMEAERLSSNWKTGQVLNR